MVLASKTKTPSIHQKKRQGQHHKPSKAYHKTYWPYLPMLFIVALGIAVNGFWGHASHGVLGYATDVSASELLADTNVQRTANGEGGLNLNSQLDNAAQAKANNMAALNYWSHDTPSGQPPWVFIQAAGYSYTAAGENLAYGFDTSQDVLTAWMGSPDHRANILNGAYRDVGFGIANSTNYQSSGPETIIVAEYGEPASSPAPVQHTQASTPVTTPTPVATTAPTPTSTASPVTTQSNTATPTPTVSTAKPSTPPSTADPKPTPASTPVSLEATPVSRMALISNNAAPVSAFMVTMVAVLCFAILFVRHGIIWKRVLQEGEEFAIRYHVLDVVLITVGVVGFLVTRNAGFIH
jgi:uncharacterized protein YkwD